MTTPAALRSLFLPPGTLPLAALPLAVLLAGCPGLLPDPPRDGGVVEPEPDPQPEPEPEPEPEPDDAGAPDDGGTPDEPLRTVGQRTLLGGLPVHNRFLDPWLTLSNNGWIFYSEDPFALPQVTSVQRPRTPFGAPALKLPEIGNPLGVMILGVAKSSAGALEVSVWVARTEGAPDPSLGELTASFIGVYPEAEEAAVDLVMDLGAEPLVEHGLVWRRFHAMIHDGPIGWGYLFLSDGSPADLYFAAPVLLSVPSAGLAASPVSAGAFAGPPRPLSAGERAGLARARAQLRDQLAPPRLPSRREDPGVWDEVGGPPRPLGGLLR